MNVCNYLLSSRNVDFRWSRDEDFCRDSDRLRRSFSFGERERLLRERESFGVRERLLLELDRFDGELCFFDFLERDRLRVLFFDRDRLRFERDLDRDDLKMHKNVE